MTIHQQSKDALLNAEHKLAVPNKQLSRYMFNITCAHVGDSKLAFQVPQARLCRGFAGHPAVIEKNLLDKRTQMKQATTTRYAGY